LTPQYRFPKIHPKTQRDIHRETYRCHFNGKRDIPPPESCCARRFVADDTFSRRYVPLLLPVNDQSGDRFVLDYLHRQFIPVIVRFLQIDGALGGSLSCL
jgi:hypothetical protein